MRPSVSVVVTAYNYGRYLGEALDSVLGQDYPAERVEAIVIDDGSTDDTAAVAQRYVDRFPGRVRLISQENRGYVGAVNRGIEEADGELLALLDADDAWMPGKLPRQVEVLEQRPDVGLVFGDVLPVGADSAPLDRETLMSGIRPIPTRAAARVFVENVALHSTILVRRALATPIPAEIPIADWWITLLASMASDISWFTDTIVRYRIHGENMGSGRHGGTPTIAPHMRDIRFKLHAMRTLDLDMFTPLELAQIWGGVEESANLVLSIGATHFAHLTGTLDVDPEQAASYLEQANEAQKRGAFAREALLIVKSLAWNPYAPGLRVRLHEAVARAEASAQAEAAEVPNPLDGARSVVILTDAEELLAGDEMLSAYASAMDGVHVATLAIDASRLPAQSAEEDLAALVSRCGLADREDIDMLAVVGPREGPQRARMLAGVNAHYRREAGASIAGDGGWLPGFSPQTISGLRAFVERQRPAAGATNHNGQRSR